MVDYSLRPNLDTHALSPTNQIRADCHSLPHYARPAIIHTHF